VLLSSLRTRLLVLVLVAVVPALGVLLFSAVAQRRLQLGEAMEEAEAVATLVAEQQQRSVDAARGLLLGITQMPQMRDRDEPGCNAALAPLLERPPYFTNMGAVAHDGTMYCSAVPRTGPVNLADRPFISGALRTGDFAVGEFAISRVAKIPALGFGYPIHDASGAIVGAAFASLNVRFLQAQLEALPLPPGADVAVVDRAGVVLTAVPEGGVRMGQRFDAGLLAAVEAASGAVELTGSDGIPRIYGFRPVLGGEDVAAMRVVAGLPAASAYEAVNGILARTLAGFGAVSALALLAAGVAAELFLVRKLRVLIAAARRIAAGDYSARSGLRPGREELGDLIRAFDEMAHSLEALSRQNRLLLDSVGEGIVGLDPEGRIVFANPAACRVLGRSAEELLGRGAHETLCPSEPGGRPVPEDECGIHAALRDGLAHAAEGVHLRRSDGTRVPVEYTSAPLLEAGVIRGAVVTFKDVTDRTRLEEHLRQSQKMEAVGQLAGGVAHDFNNLLTAMMSFTRFAQDRLGDGHPAQEDLREVVAAAKRAAELTRQLLTFSRRQRIEPRVIDLADSVRGVEQMLRRLIGEDVVLETRLAPGAWTVRVDPSQIELVLLNLAVNARDAMPTGGRLTISVGDGGEGDRAAAARASLSTAPPVVMTVEDTGVGMDADTAARAFEPFFTTKAPGRGTGLGLSTVYGIVAQAGGAIHLRTAPGQGAEFRIVLPRHAGEADDQDAAEPARGAGGTETVLVVEDDDVLRALAVRALGSAGYRVLQAEAPEVALEVSRRHRGTIDLLVSDVLLPEENGWTLSKRIERERPGIAVLYMSGFTGGRWDGVEVLPPGVPFLAKPFTPEGLQRKVREVLDASAVARRSAKPGAASA
jgi:PAS domain S-box-containing protein